MTFAVFILWAHVSTGTKSFTLKVQLFVSHPRELKTWRIMSQKDMYNVGTKYTTTFTRIKKLIQINSVETSITQLLGFFFLLGQKPKCVYVMVQYKNCSHGPVYNQQFNNSIN